MIMKTKFFIVALFLTFSILAHTQTDAGVKITPKQGELYDNTKNLNNPYRLPLGGKKLGARGFLLPYPIGIMINGYAGEQDVTISDLSVGFNDGEMINLDDVVKFGDVAAKVRNLNMRADIWALPFLDIYGIFGKAWVETDVNIAEILGKSANLSTQANFDGYVYGMGAMLTGGIRSIFFSLDFNKVWTHFDELKNDNSAMNLSPRVGYIFHFDHQPEKNISVWTGATRVYLNNQTIGKIALADIDPNMGENYKNSDWYEGLRDDTGKTPAQIAKDDKIADMADALAGKFTEEHKDDVINYSLNKRPSHNWFMILGTQFQLDRHWQFRTEVNFLGGHKSGLISANYRFGIR